MNSIPDFLSSLNRTGGIVYPSGTDPAVFCWCGVENGHVWFHRGDKPAWGPKIDDLKQFGDTAIGNQSTDGTLTFYMTTMDDCPEIATGQAMMIVTAQRQEISRETAIEWLGDPPADSGLAGQTENK